MSRRSRVRFDHIEWAVADMGAAGRHFAAQSGLASVAGGQHPAWGTANMIVPLGHGYLELITVVDPAVAATASIGAKVAETIAHGGGLAGWGVGVEDLPAVARRLGLAISEGRRERTDGSVLSWQMCGLDEGFARGLPFFMTWEHDHPERALAPHRVTPQRFAWLETGNDLAELAEWLGPHQLDVRRVDAPPGPVRCAIATSAGEVIVP